MDLYLKTTFAVVSVGKVRKEPGESSLLGSWLGRDRAISGAVGLQSPHSVLNSLYYVVFFKRVGWGG